MTQARKSQVSIEDTPYYHCMGRCVRRAFLCGEDKLTGKDFSHRKQWIIDKLKELTEVYTIEVCAYAIMSNHYHVVLKVNNSQSEQFSDKEVVKRWTKLFNGNVLVQRFIAGQCKSQAEKDKAHQEIQQWRERLADISWFMRCLNESIARQANAEDNCKGRFWEGRFKSQALLNEQAVLSCMIYVDLNPVRAGLSDSLDESEFTSITQRIKAFSLSVDKQKTTENSQSSECSGSDDSPSLIKLMDFVGGQQKEGIPYTFMDYLELADWTGRAIRNDKKGFIPDKEPKILHKLDLSPNIWLKTIAQFSEHFYSHLGTEK